MYQQLVPFYRLEWFGYPIGGGGATLTACGSVWAKDQTHATAVTQATAVTVPDP